MSTVLPRAPIRRDYPELGVPLFFHQEELADPASFEAAVRRGLEALGAPQEELECLVAQIVQRESAPVVGRFFGVVVSPELRCVSTVYDRAGSRSRCALEAGHRGRHDDGAMTWCDPSPAVAVPDPSLLARGAALPPSSPVDASSAPPSPLPARTAPRRVRAELPPFLVNGWAVPDPRRPDLWRIERVQVHRGAELVPFDISELEPVQLEGLDRALRLDIHAQVDALMAAPVHVRLYCLRTGLNVEAVS
jgi:hypothetical protein